MMATMIWTPVHFPMLVTVKTPNCDKTNVEGNSTQSPAAIFKSQLSLNKKKAMLVKPTSNLCKPTVTRDCFRGCPAVEAAKYEDLFLSSCLQHNCCMAWPLLSVRDALMDQTWWIFEKLPKGLWPPPYFRKTMLRFLQRNFSGGSDPTLFHNLLDKPTHLTVI